MAGVKGRSGGARPNSGPKPKAPKLLPASVTPKAAPKTKLHPEIAAALEEKLVDDSGQTPLEFLLSVMRNPSVDEKLRIDAAKTAAMYCHLKKGDGGIKDEKAEKAKKAGAGKFGAAPPPLRMIK